MDKTKVAIEKWTLSAEHRKAFHHNICIGVYKQLHQDGYLNHSELTRLLSPTATKK